MMLRRNKAMPSAMAVARLAPFGNTAPIDVHRCWARFYSARRILTGNPQDACGRQKLKLDQERRWQVAGEAVEELRRYGGWKELDEEAPMRPLAPSSGPHDKREING